MTVSNHLEQTLSALYDAFKVEDEDTFYRLFKQPEVLALGQDIVNVPMVELIPELQEGVRDFMGMPGIFTKFYHHIMTPPQLNGLPSNLTNITNLPFLPPLTRIITR